jgi:hypothetical protein
MQIAQLLFSYRKKLITHICSFGLAKGVPKLFGTSSSSSTSFRQGNSGILPYRVICIYLQSNTFTFKIKVRYLKDFLYPVLDNTKFL